MRNIIIGIQDEGEWAGQCFSHQAEDMIRNGPRKIGKVTKITADKGKIGLFPFDSLDLRDPVYRLDLCDVASQSIDRIRGIYHQPPAVQAVGDDLQMTLTGIFGMYAQEHEYQFSLFEQSNIRSTNSDFRTE
jgi:hypothetical protein